jgi:carbon monoxide dehydrogenase subunit G
MATIRADSYIDCSPDEVWSVVGDIGGLSTWMPGVQASALVRDQRVCELSVGSPPLVEMVLSRDDAKRRYDYTIVDGPMSFDHHRAAMWLEPEGAGSRYTWEMTIEPDEAAEPMRAIAEAGAEALKSHIESIDINGAARLAQSAPHDDPSTRGGRPARE